MDEHEDVGSTVEGCIEAPNEMSNRDTEDTFISLNELYGKELRALYIGVEGKAIKIWSREEGILDQKLYNQAVNNLKSSIQYVSEKIRSIRDDNKND